MVSDVIFKEGKKMSNISIAKGSKEVYGHCNFHSSNEHYITVYELRGDQTTVRICNKCLKSILSVAVDLS